MAQYLNDIAAAYGVSFKELKMKPHLIKKIRAAALNNMSVPQKARFKHIEDIIKQIPRPEMDEHAKYIRSKLRTAVLAGSYRRGAPMSHDIDVVIREPISVARSKLGTKYIKDIVSCGDQKCTLIVKFPGKPHRLLDLLHTTSTSHPFALMYMTGPKRHNIRMRLLAKSKGYKLNEFGLFKDGDFVDGIKTEKDLIAILRK
jgi:DNA polymerase/3'-5' exonuclease PolX